MSQNKTIAFVMAAMLGIFGLVYACSNIYLFVLPYMTEKVIIGLVILILVPPTIAAFMFMRWAQKKRNKTPVTEVKEEVKKKRTENDVPARVWKFFTEGFGKDLGISLILLIFCHIAISAVWNDEWVRWNEQDGSLTCSLFLVLGGAAVLSKSKLIKNCGIALTLVAVVCNVVLVYRAINTETPVKNITKKSMRSDNIKKSVKLEEPTLPPHNLDNEKLFRKRFEKELPGRNIEDFTCVIRNESGFNQFNLDGTLLLNHNINGTVDKGFGQINQVNWPEAKRLGYNLDTLKGNMDFTLYFYKKNGMDPWISTFENKCGGQILLAKNSFSVVSSEVKKITVPLDEWSEKVVIPAGFTTAGYKLTGTVIVRDTKELNGTLSSEEYLDGPQLNPGKMSKQTRCLQFKAVTKEEIATVSYR